MKRHVKILFSVFLGYNGFFSAFAANFLFFAPNHIMKIKLYYIINVIWYYIIKIKLYHVKFTQ